jgi:hypothetical protein
MHFMLLLLLPLVGALLIQSDIETLHFSIPIPRAFFLSLDFSYMRTLNGFAALMMADWSPLAHAYHYISFYPGQATAIYNHFIGKPDYHKDLLPLDFFFQNPFLLSGLDKDWGRYNAGVLEILRKQNMMYVEPWRSRILRRVVEHPELAGAWVVAKAASTENFPKAWELGYKLSTPLVPVNLTGWLGERGWLLTIINAFICDFTMYSFDRFLPFICSLAKFHQTDATDKADSVLFDNFMFKSENPDLYEKLLMRVMILLKDEGHSRRALWHGKLLFLALRFAKSLTGQLSKNKILVRQYFIEYKPVEHHLNIVSSLGPLISAQRLLQEPLEPGLVTNLKALQERHRMLRPFWGGAERYLSYWRLIQASAGVFKPPVVPCTWDKACEVLQPPEPGRFLIGKQFANPFIIVDRDGRHFDCVDVLCLLKHLPPIILAESGLFLPTADSKFRLFKKGDPPIYIVTAIGWLIILGLAYNHSDPFKLSHLTWDKLYGYNGVDNNWHDLLGQVLGQSHLQIITDHQRVYE